MVRRPSPDEKLLLTKLPPEKDQPGPTTVFVNIHSNREDPYVERILLSELATYLNHSHRELKRLAVSWGALHQVSIKTPKRGCVFWVTPDTAQRLIIHARSKQGEMFHKGINYYGLRERWRRRNARKWAKKKAAKNG